MSSELDYLQPSDDQNAKMRHTAGSLSLTGVRTPLLAANWKFSALPPAVAWGTQARGHTLSSDYCCVYQLVMLHNTCVISGHTVSLGLKTALRCNRLMLCGI